MIEDILQREIEGATLDRVHFFSCGDFSLIHEEFGKRHIVFAHPTQTLSLNKA